MFVLPIPIGEAGSFIDDFGSTLGDLNPFGGRSEEERQQAASEDAASFACQDSPADTDLAEQVIALAERDTEARNLLDKVISQVNFAGPTPSTLREKACYYARITRDGWPSPGDPPYTAQQELLDLVENAADVTVDTATPPPSEPSTGDRLLSTLEEILLGPEGVEGIEDRLAGAGRGAVAGAETGARSAGFLDRNLPWLLLGGVLLVVILVATR